MWLLVRAQSSSSTERFAGTRYTCTRSFNSKDQVQVTWTQSSNSVICRISLDSLWTLSGLGRPGIPVLGLSTWFAGTRLPVLGLLTRSSAESLCTCWCPRAGQDCAVPCPALPCPVPPCQTHQWVWILPFPCPTLPWSDPWNR